MTNPVVHPTTNPVVHSTPKPPAPSPKKKVIFGSIPSSFSQRMGLPTDPTFDSHSTEDINTTVPPVAPRFAAAAASFYGNRQTDSDHTMQSKVVPVSILRSPLLPPRPSTSYASDEPSDPPNIFKTSSTARKKSRDDPSWDSYDRDGFDYGPSHSKIQTS